MNYKVLSKNFDWIDQVKNINGERAWPDSLYSKLIEIENNAINFDKYDFIVNQYSKIAAIGNNVRQTFEMIMDIFKNISKECDKGLKKPQDIFKSWNRHWFNKVNISNEMSIETYREKYEPFFKSCSLLWYVANAWSHHAKIQCNLFLPLQSNVIHFLSTFQYILVYISRNYFSYSSEIPKFNEVYYSKDKPFDTHKLIESETIPIYSFIKQILQNNSKISLPIYQRNFAWGNKQFEYFLNGIYEIIETKSQEPHYFEIW